MVAVGVMDGVGVILGVSVTLGVMVIVGVDVTVGLGVTEGVGGTRTKAASSPQMKVTMEPRTSNIDRPTHLQPAAIFRLRSKKYRRSRASRICKKPIKPEISDPARKMDSIRYTDPKIVKI